MNFSFNDAPSSFVSDSIQYLKPYNIYKVHLEKLEKTKLNGKDGTVYDVVTVEFVGEDGSLTENIFLPREERDFVRNENQNTHKLIASGFDRLQFTLMQIITVLNPTGAEKIQEAVKKWPAATSVEKAVEYVNKFVQLAEQAVAKYKDTEMYLKVVGRNSGGKTFACLPNACLIMDGKPKALNFVSKDQSKLYFSSYEDQQAKQFKEAKPTSMPSTDSSIDEAPVDIDDLSFD